MPDDHAFLLQRVQPAMVGLIDGSLSTLAPIFAVVLASHDTRYAFIAGLATSLGAAISMGFSEALSDTGELTGRGSPWGRGTITGGGTFLGGIAGPVPQLDDAGVATRPFGEPRPDVGEELVHDLLRTQDGKRLPARVEVAPPPERDHLLGERLHSLCLRLCRPNPPVLDQRAREVRVERLAVRRVAAELLPCAGVAHRRLL